MFDIKNAINFNETGYQFLWYLNQCKLIVTQKKTQIQFLCAQAPWIQILNYFDDSLSAQMLLYI